MPPSPPGGNSKPTFSHVEEEATSKAIHDKISEIIANMAVQTKRNGMISKDSTVVEDGGDQKDASDGQSDELEKKSRSTSPKCLNNINVRSEANSLGQLCPATINKKKGNFGMSVKEFLNNNKDEEESKERKTEPSPCPVAAITEYRL